MRRLPLRAAALALAACTFPAWSQPTATRAIKLVVPYAAGTPADTIARALAERLQPALGQPVIVENRPGAGGTIGAEQVARSMADGTTLLVQSSAHTVNPHVYASLGYDTLLDFAGITPLATLPKVLIVATGHFSSVAELVAASRAAKPPLRYATPGIGSPSHLNAERFRFAAGIEATHVPAKSPTDALADTLAGRADWYFAPLVNAAAAIRDRRATALAVGTPRRAASLPDVPTTREAGIPGSDYTHWIGLFAPARTPREIVDRLHVETVKAISSAEMRERLAQLGAEPWTLPPSEFDQHVRDEVAANAAIVGATGIRPN
jgi:tripartite-type tricarboxylate transporter receptor subunit TctC